MSKSQLRPGLSLLATPIGNADDLTFRGSQALRDADVLVCEDTRMARRLMEIHGIPVAGRPMIAYHDHNAREAMPRILEHLEAGARVVALSDAGTPLIADPGYRLAREALDAGHPITALPGPCAAIMALTLSGLPSDRFAFAGFAPVKSGARQTFFAEFVPVPSTLIFYESPKRLAASLSDMLAVFGPREAAVARELTKLFEEVRRGSLDTLTAHYAEAGAPKGEVVVVVGPPAAPAPPAPADIDAALHAAMATESLKDAARDVAQALGLKRREVYERALMLKSQDD